VIVLFAASFTYIVAQCFGIGIITSRFLGIGFEVAIFVGLLGILVCSMLGGMRAVTWTQVAQYIILIISYLVPVIWLSTQKYGIPIPELTYGQALDQIAQLEQKLGIVKAHVSAFSDATGKFSWTEFNNFWALVLCLMIGTASLPHILMRYFTTPSVREARTSVAWSIFFIFLLYFTAPAYAAFAKVEVYQNVIGQPIAALQSGLEDWLNGLSGSNAILLGIIIGLMMAFDMGGPVNKVAYAFGLAALASGNLKVMAAVMAAGMTPPLGLALATVVRKNLFTRAERQAGEAGWLLGASFITEGAIPFAAADPLRVIPALMVGSAVTGALVMGFGNTSRAPHGGIWVVGLIGKPLLYVLAILIGTVITAAGVIILKMAGRKEAADIEPAASRQATATS